MAVDFNDEPMSGVWFNDPMNRVWMTLCESAARGSCLRSNNEVEIGPKNQYFFYDVCSTDPCSHESCEKYLGGNPHVKR